MYTISNIIFMNLVCYALRIHEITLQMIHFALHALVFSHGHLGFHILVTHIVTLI